MLRIGLTAVLACSCLSGTPARLVAADNARMIMDEVQRRGESKSLRYEGLLQTIEGSGKASEKRWIFERLGANGQSKSVIRFTSPAEVKGVALLIFNHSDKLSDQWMWTPALERDRRVATQDRSTRFFGTDFSFEDLEERDVNQYEYALLGEEAIAGAPCWKLQWTPLKTSQYTKVIVWVRKDNYALAKADSYVKDQVVRQLDYNDIQNIQGIWTARDLTMTDLRRNSKTRLTLDKIEYNAPLKEDDFTLQAIRR